jgi:hypothetical protein
LLIFRYTIFTFGLKKATLRQNQMILYAALDPAIASRARQGNFVKCLDHFNLLLDSCVLAEE